MLVVVVADYAFCATFVGGSIWEIHFDPPLLSGVMFINAFSSCIYFQI